MNTTISVVMRHSYSDGMEAIPFLSAENARDWMEKDIQCAAKMLEEQGYTPVIYGQGVEAEGQESISYDYWLDTDQEFLDEPESPVTKSFCIVVTSCYCGDRCGTCAYPFYSEQNARKWIAEELLHAIRIIKSMGYTPLDTVNGNTAEILAKESTEVHFSAWLCGAETLMDVEPEADDKFACYEEPFTGARFTKAEWLDWYGKHGKKDNFASPEDWWDEMIRMSLLVPEDDERATPKIPEKEPEKEQLLSETVTQRCNACGRTFDLIYHSDGTYDYADEGAVCGCDSDFSPVDGPSLSEWLEDPKLKPVEECRRYLVFIDSDYVRDAQAYLGESLSDDIDLYDEEHEDCWRAISGDMLILDRYAGSPQEVIGQVQEMYPDASSNIFTAIEILTVPSEAAYREIGIADGADGKWDIVC